MSESRKSNGKLNLKFLNQLGSGFKDLADKEEKARKKNDPKAIRKLTDQRDKALKGAPTRATLIGNAYKKEKAKRQTEALRLRTELVSMRNAIYNYRNKGVGVIVSKSNNLTFYDTTTTSDLKRMGKSLTIMTESNIDKQRITQRISLLETAGQTFQKKLRDRKFKKIGGKIHQNKFAGGVAYNYIFPFADDDEFNIMDTMDINIKRAFNNSRYKHPNAMFNVRLSTEEGEGVYKRSEGKGKGAYVDKAALSLPRYDNWTLDDVLDLFNDKFEIWEATYDEDELEGFTDFKSVMISYLVPPKGIFGSGGHLNMDRANKKWLIYDTTATYNCFYRCIAFHRLLEDWEAGKLSLERIDKHILEEGEHRIKTLINDRAKTIKQRINTTRKTTTDEDIQNWVNSMGKRSDTRCMVKMYDNVFSLIKTYRPVYTSSAEGNFKTYEIWNANYHFTPLIRWNTIPICREIFRKKFERDVKLLEEEEEEGVIEKPVIIDKKFARLIVNEEHYKNWVYDKYNVDEENLDGKMRAKYKGLYKYHHQSNPELVEHKPITLNQRIGTYDLEATGNGNDGFFTSYRCSFAFNELVEDCIDGLEFRRIQVESFGGKDCIRLWFEWLFKNRKQFHNYTFYAHNGGKFDLLLLLNEYIVHTKEFWKIDTTSTICLNGAYINLTLISSDNECEINFKDSLRLLPMGLDKLTKEFNVPHKKIGEDLSINFDEINTDNCFGEKDISTLQKPFSSLDFRIELSQRVYCDYDVVGLLECLNIMNEEVHTNMSLDLTKQLTGASLSKNNFYKNYYDKSQFPIYYLTKELDMFCREGYSGGRNEAFYIGEWKKKCYYYDFTSLYPDVARRIVPYGHPSMYLTGQIERWNKLYKEKKTLPLFVGMMKFRVKTKDFNALPVYAIKKDGKLLFPHFGEWTEITIWSNEFNYANELGIYDHILIAGVEFRMNKGQMTYKKGERDTYWKEEGILAPFFSDGVERKALAKKQYKLALALCWKVIINSGYGFWGLNVNGDDGMGRDGMEITDKDDLHFWNLVKDKCVSNVGNNGEYMFIRTSKPMPQTDFNVAIAGAITSEARIKIHKFMNAVRKVGGNLLYCDTDSCICDIRLCDYPVLAKEFCWDGTGEALGSMKNEAEEKLEKYFNKKVVKEDFKGNRKAEVKRLLEFQKECDNGEYHFDKGIIAGCKQYGLRKKVFDGGYIEASASKGCKKDLEYREFHHLLFGSMMEEQKVWEEKIKEDKAKEGIEWTPSEGFRLYEEQKQFRSGLITHLKEDTADGNVPVRIVSLNKAMRICYKKGLVENEANCDGVSTNGIVKPLIL